MSTKTRPGRGNRTKRNTATIAVVLIVALLIACGVYLGVRSMGGAGTVPEATSSVRPTVPEVTSISEPPPPPPNEGEPPAGWGSFEMTGAATITGATYDVMPYALPLNPAGPQATMVRWVDGLGVSPTNANDGTVYVLGHAWGQQRLVFNPFSETVTAAVDLNAPPAKVPATDDGTVDRRATDALNGSVITMADDEGKAREWVVDNAWLVDKYEAIYDKELMDEHKPGRIVLIACSVEGSNDLGYLVIVSGHLR